MKRLLLISTCVLSFQLCYSQFEKEYQPIIQTYNSQEEFTTDYSAQFKKSVAEEKELNLQEATALYNAVYAEKKKIFSNGQIYFNDELTEYVKKVLQELLKNSPELQSKVKVYVTRYSSANAYALVDGTIMVNAGLLARLENEAQLAFILGHELAHYEKRHSVKEILKMKQVQSQEKNSSYDVSVFRKLRYSREAEFEADSRGIQLMVASGYDARESKKALKLLTDTLYKYPSMVNTLITTLSSENIKIDSSFFRSDKSAGNENSKNNIVLGSLSEDLYTTHPDMNKRIDALQEILNLVSYDAAGKAKNILYPEQKISEINQRSFFEMIDNLHRQTDYNLSLYLCLGIQELYPENAYIPRMILKNIYWLSYYKELDNIENTFNTTTLENTESLRLLDKFLSNVSHNDLKKICFEYTKKHLETMKNNEEFFLYYALVSEMYLGKEPSKIIYSQHLMKFPNSRFYSYVNTKTK